MRARALAGVVLVAGILLAGCAPAADSIDGTGPAVSELHDPAADRDPAVPEVCEGPFPFAFGTPDDSGMTLRPAQWPAPPQGAVLCGTSTTVTGQQENADFAYDGGQDALFAHYEAGLADHAPEVVDLGTGPGLTGTADGVVFVVKPVEGGFSLIFQEETL